MFHYEKKFEPYTRDGATLEGSIKWLKKTTDADDRIIDLAIATTMNKLDQGEKFLLPCPCGCDINNIHTTINHFMLSVVFDLQSQADKLIVKAIEEKQKLLVESQLKQLSNFDKEYYRMIHGKWYQRLWKWLSTYEGLK
jgi:hypothetical protein